MAVLYRSPFLCVEHPGDASDDDDAKNPFSKGAPIHPPPSGAFTLLVTLLNVAAEWL